MKRIRDAAPPPTARPDVPASLERLLRSAMARDVSARPASALDLVRSLQAIEMCIRDREEARHHHLRNVITRSVGSDPAPQVDLWVMPQMPGERFLVCSDGVTSELSDEQIAAVVLHEADTREAAERLVDEALSAGGRDNTSVIIVDFTADVVDQADEATLPRMRIAEGL